MVPLTQFLLSGLPIDSTESKSGKCNHAHNKNRLVDSDDPSTTDLEKYDGSSHSLSKFTSLHFKAFVGDKNVELDEALM